MKASSSKRCIETSQGHGHASFGCTFGHDNNHSISITSSTLHWTTRICSSLCASHCNHPSAISDSLSLAQLIFVLHFPCIHLIPDFSSLPPARHVRLIILRTTPRSSHLSHSVFYLGAMLYGKDFICGSCHHHTELWIPAAAQSQCISNPGSPSRRQVSEYASQASRRKQISTIPGGPGAKTWHPCNLGSVQDVQRTPPHES